MLKPHLCLVFLITCVQNGFSNKYSESPTRKQTCQSGHCSVEDEGPCMDDGKPKLYRWDPVKVKWSIYYLVIGSIAIK